MMGHAMTDPSRVQTLLRRLRRSVESCPMGLAEALSEMGPNHATEFADALAIEGVEKPIDGVHRVTESLGRFRDALVDFLQVKAHAFAGGVAVRSYGARVTPTNDYDFLIDPAQLSDVMAFMEGQRAVLQGVSEDTFLFTLKFETLIFHVDVLAARSPLHREVLEKAKAAFYAGRKLRIATPDCLAAMKVKAYHERLDEDKRRTDRADVVGLLTTRQASESGIRDILKRHRPDLLPVLDEILASK